MMNLFDKDPAHYDPDIGSPEDDPHPHPETEQDLYRQRTRKVGKIILFTSLGLLLIALLWAGFFVWRVHLVSEKIVIKKEESSLIDDTRSIISSFIPSPRKTLKGEENGRINVLLLGMAGKNNPGRNLTDTIMIMSIDTENKKVALLSLPRDLYVNIPNTQSYTKINSLYQYGLNNDKGLDPLVETVGDITGLNIDYFLALNYAGFKKIIDDIGGINITSERDIYDARYPGPNYSYEVFELAKGFHEMDGKTALKYVRSRHGDPEGDFGRAKRQQQVIQVTKNKVFSLKTFLNVVTLNKLLNSLEENVETNIELDDIESFIALSKEVDSENINNAVVDAWKKDSLLKVSHAFFSNVRAFILIPRVGNFSEIQELAKNIFDLDKVKERQQKIESEEASIVIINQSGDNTLAGKIKNLLKDKLNFENVAIKSSGPRVKRGETIAIDQTKGKKIFSLDEVITRLPAKLSEEKGDIIEEDADIIVILGRDLIYTYSFEEYSFEDLDNAGFDQQYLELIREK